MDITNETLEYLIENLNTIPGIKLTLAYTSENDGREDSPLFKEYAQYWLKTYCLGKVKNNTYSGTYQDPVDGHLIPYFGDFRIKNIKPDDVQKFFNQKALTSSLESQKKMKACLKRIFEVACTNGVCRCNPVTSILRLSSQVDPKVKHVWTQKQYDIAWEFAKHHKNGLHILILLETAITRSELLGLHRRDHDISNSVLYINRGRVLEKDPVTGKTSIVEDGLKNKYRERAIPISKELNAAIYLHPRVIFVCKTKVKGVTPKQVCPSHIVYSPEGFGCRPDNWYKRVFKPFMRELHEAHPEVPILTTHELRHTRATLLKNKVVDIYSIARLLGHCDLDMLAKRYAHDDVDALRIALSK